MNALKPPKIEFEDFAVVNFMSKELTPQIETWRETAHVCAAQSCARQTWFGSYSEAMHSFPVETINPDKVDFLRGKDAYLFMLRLMLGLESKTVGETNICGQMNEGWRVFMEQLPEDAARLRPIYDALTADSRLIRGRVLDNHFINPTLANAATRLSQKKGGEVVTIVAHGERNGGSLSEETRDLINRFAAVKKNFASKIILLAANDAIKSLIDSTLRDLNKKGYLQPDVDIKVKKATVSNLHGAFNESSLIFCAKPMAPTDTPEQRFDDEMVLAWYERSAQDDSRKFIHLHGVPQKRGASSRLWRDFGLAKYHSPENVANEQTIMRATNERVLGVAGNNASIFARLRSEGTQPGKKHLSLV